MAKNQSPKKSLSLKTPKPALTPSETGATAYFVKKPKRVSAKSKKHEIPEGLWRPCPQCRMSIFNKTLDENLKVCPHCQYHFPIFARARIRSLVETRTFEEIDADIASVDILRFTDTEPYTSRLQRNLKSTGLKEAAVTGICKIGEHRVALGVLDFSFMGGSMGSAVGEKVVRLIEKATEMELPLIVVSASGGARMQEGMFSLMQMAKTCGALAFYAKTKLPYISVMTNPTLGGVLASFASVSSLIIAEPGAIIGLSGPRVYQEAIQTELPEGFQTAEFLVARGLIDAIVPRKEMKQRLSSYLSYLSAGRMSVA